MEAYIYTYVNKETGKTYIGSRSAYKGSCYDDFNIKYFSSSKDKQFRQDMADGKLEGQIVLVMNDEKANKKIVEVEAKMITAYWEKYGKENSYNHYAKGKFSTAGTHLSNETKNKLREANLGKHHTENTKKKISEVSKGRVLSDTARKNISNTKKGEKNPMYNKHWSDESKRKMIETKKKNGTNFRTEETKKKISESKKGYHHTKETIEKMRKPKQKYKWITPDGEIKIMDKHNATMSHPDWVLITE